MPTAVGRQLLNRANALLEQAAHPPPSRRWPATSPPGRSRSCGLAVETVFPRADLHAVLARLADAFPHVRVELHETVIHGAADLLAQGQVDIAITPVLPKVGTFRTLGRIRFTPRSPIPITRCTGSGAR